MPLFVAVHKWNPEEMIAVTKEMVPMFAAIVEGKFPEEITLCATYMAGDLQGAFCVWNAPSKEALEKVFDQAPTVKKGTEIVPVVQSYPPTMEYVLALYQQMIQAASK